MLRNVRRKRKSLHNPKDCADFYSGDPAGIRTPDTLLKRQVLCRLSYWVKLGCVMDAGFVRLDMAGTDGFAFLRKSHGGSNNPPDCLQEPPFESGHRRYNGRDGWIRTSECRRQRPMPYRLATPLYPLNQKTGRTLSITRCGRQRVIGSYGVGKGTRTLDPRNHNPML